MIFPKNYVAACFLKCEHEINLKLRKNQEQIFVFFSERSFGKN